MQKNSVYFLLFIFCIGNSSTHLAVSLKECWDFANKPVSAAILSGLLIPITYYYLHRDPEKEELEKEDIKSVIELRNTEKGKMKQQIALQDRSDWQDEYIKTMAAEAFQQSDPEVLKQKKREKELEFEVKQLQIDSAQLEIAKEKISFLDKLKERVSATRKLLQNESLSEEEQAEKYAELVNLRGMFNRISSPTA